MESLKKHNKHAKLVKPNNGQFSTYEIGILGTDCASIKGFVYDVFKYLDKSLNIAYVDADHSTDRQTLEIDTLQDKIGYYQFNTNKLSKTLRLFLLSKYDIIFVNGNHFEANNQIVFIDPKKEESLKRRKTQLSNVLFTVSINNDKDIYEWLLSDQIILDSPCLSLNNIENIAEAIIKNKPKTNVKGLILTGGKSLRMGENKADIQYYNHSQKHHLTEIFQQLETDSYISVAKEGNNQNEIVDTFTDLGPYGGILSAFRTDPNSAWLTIACDLPLIGSNEISFLYKNRNPNAIATACFNPETGFPDPLFTIWEPKAYPILLQYLANGVSCPRKVLINENTHIINLPNPAVLQNINTPEERDLILKTLNP